MNKKFLFYLIIWFIFIVLFNVIVFVTPSSINGMYKYGGAFWTGYIFITVAFVGHLGCAYYALRTDNNTKLFFNIPIISVSLFGLIASGISGVICMVWPNFPKWIGIILCFTVLAVTAVAVIMAVGASAAVEYTEKDLKNKISFISYLRGEAEALVVNANSEEGKREAQKVYDALRYSDPVSKPELYRVESQIDACFRGLAQSISAGDDSIEAEADKLVKLINERNKRCKWVK